MSIKHDELLRHLTRHLRNSTDRMVWTDMQLGPMHSTRPDAWTLNKSYSTPRPLAYEVKVSKADYQRDVSSGKWQDYLAYSCAVIFAVPLGLISKADLPKGCGLMVWNGEVWTTTKAPTLNPCPSLPRDLWMKLLIDGVERQAVRQRVECSARWHAEDAVRKKFGATVAALVAEECNFESRLEQVRQRFKEAEERERERSEERRKQDDATITTARREICEALNLPIGTAPWGIRNRVRELTVAVSKDHEVQELRRHLEMVRNALGRADQTPTARVLAEREIKL